MAHYTSSLVKVLDRYPAVIAAGQREQIARWAFEMSLFLPGVPAGGRVCDLGGGWGTLALGCAAAGFRSVVVDDYRDPGFADDVTVAAMRGLYEEHGVEVVSRDLVRDGLDFPDGSFDAITCIDSVEHWHGSPRRVLQDAVRALKPGGRLVLGAPNCVNLRKRITVPFGRGKWSAFDDWYGHELFRGHVREPDVDDLHHIARDLGLRNARVFGRNWAGYLSTRPFVRSGTVVFDRLLRLRPSLCSDLYLVGDAPH